MGEEFDTDALIAELRESEERFRTICENAPVMIDQFDADGRCTLFNRECEKRLGYTFADMVKCDDPLALVYPDQHERDRVLESIRRADGTFREYTVRAKDGSARIQMWADFRLPNGALISVGHDVTEQRAIEQQLRHSQKMDALGQLTSGMAHDFNNLLTVVLANADMLAREQLEPEVMRLVNEVIGAASQGAGLIRKLLAFSRNAPMEVRAVDINGVVNSLATTITPLLPDAIRVDADSGSVEQVLLNLVMNARDAMPQGGLLSIRVGTRTVTEHDAATLGCRVGDHIAVSVTDDGTGMDDITLHRALEPFFTTKGGSGTGLGLPMAYGLMQQQGGALEMESTVGVGTTATLLLPIQRTRAPTPRRRRTHAKRVLVVEDQVAIQRVTQTVLTEADYDVELASNGAIALAILQGDHDIDLILCDVAMPVMGGRELFEAVGRSPGAPPFLFITGNADSSGLPEGDDVRVLRKPYRVDQLLDVVSEVLDAAAAAVSEDVPRPPTSAR